MKSIYSALKFVLRDRHKKLPTIPLNPFVSSRIAELKPLKSPDLEVPLTRHYGQRGEDLIVKSIFDALLIQKNFNYKEVWYLEIGANHPIATSSTYLLYESGARGVLVEANPYLIDALKQVRVGDEIINAAVVGVGTGVTKLYLSVADELSTTIESNLDFWPNHPIRDVIEVEKLEIEKILTEHFPSRTFNFLSIDCEGPDFEILERIDLDLYPFDVIQIEPSSHINLNAIEGITSYLFHKGYTLVSKTEVNCIYTKVNNSTNNQLVDRPFPISKISFDIFDTLITRRFQQPKSVLISFCEKYGINFERRVQADNGMRSLEEIYIEAGIPLELMEKEIEIEIENLIPIKCNLSKVMPHDVLVSDMYLNKSQMQQILRKFNLQNNQLYVSNSDKATGKYWTSLSKDEHPILHYGDNQISDYQNAINSGIRGVLCREHEFNDFEIEIQQHNEDLAFLLRELRLSELDFNSSLVEHVSFTSNLTLLFSFCEILSQKKRNLVFLGRDCFQLYEIYKAYFGNCEYLQFSRDMLSDLDIAAQMLRSVSTPDALFVDLISTGATWTKLCDEFEVVVLIRNTNWSYSHVDPELINLKSIFTTEEVQSSIVLELLNPAREGRLIKVASESFEQNLYAEHESRPFEIEKLLYASQLVVKKATYYSRIAGAIKQPRLLAKKSLDSIWSKDQILKAAFVEQIKKEGIHLVNLMESLGGDEI